MKRIVCYLPLKKKKLLYENREKIFITTILHRLCFKPTHSIMPRSGAYEFPATEHLQAKKWPMPPPPEGRKKLETRLKPNVLSGPMTRARWYDDLMICSTSHGRGDDWLATLTSTFDNDQFRLLLHFFIVQQHIRLLNCRSKPIPRAICLFGFVGKRFR